MDPKDFSKLVEYIQHTYPEIRPKLDSLADGAFLAAGLSTLIAVSILGPREKYALPEVYIDQMNQLAKLVQYTLLEATAAQLDLSDLVDDDPSSPDPS
jgi:hypothetical protein